MHQLTSADYPGSSDFTYSYDAAGNMLETTGPDGTTTRTYDDADRLATETSSETHEAEAGAATTSGAWSDMANADTSDDAYASTSPGADATTTMNVDSFDLSSVPIDALVDEVTVDVEWRTSLATAELTLGAQVMVDGILVGTETTDVSNPASDTTATVTVEGLDRTDLENLDVVVRATRDQGDAVTASVDAVTVHVSYTLPARTFTYNDNGWMLDDGAGRVFSYDALGHLASLTGGPVDATYRYDGAGRRVGATVDGIDVDYLLDVRGLGSVLSDGSRRFLPGSPNAGYEEGGAWTNALTNSQGTVLGYVDAAGLVGTLSHFDAFGAALTANPARDTGPGYTGEWTDATGLIDLRFRAYDPTLQQFMARDTFAGTAAVPLTGNRYAYAGGNPLRYTDPSGHLWNEFLRDPGFYISLSVQMLPVAGDLYSLGIALTGYDPIAGVKLSNVERILAGLSMFTLGGGFHVGARGAGELAGSVDNIAARSLPDVMHTRTAGRALDDLPPIPRDGALRHGGDAVPTGPRGVDMPSGSAGRRAADTPTNCAANSFLPSTRVLMADGSTKAISEVEIGESVMAADPETGERGARQVTNVIVGDGSKDLVDIDIDGETITATDGHPFWVTGDSEWADAEDLEVGDELLLADGSTVAVDAVDEYTVETTVYNLTVDDIHTYFVVTGADAVLVHNCAARARLAPDPDALGPHTTFRRDPETGNVTHYETWQPQANARDPKRWASVQRVDLVGAPHYNRFIEAYVPTPHVQGRDIPGGVRPAEMWELPDGH